MRQRGGWVKNNGHMSRALTSCVLAGWLLQAAGGLAAATTNAIEALCGPAPVPESLHPAELRAQASDLRKIERVLPPVTDQGMSDWCFAHVAACLLSHQIHLSTGQPYSPSVEFSPIDLAEEGNLYLDRYTASNAISANTNHFNGKQDPLDILLCVQERGMARSIGQMAEITSDAQAEERGLAPLLAAERARDRAQFSGADTLGVSLRSGPSMANLLYYWGILQNWQRGDFSGPALKGYEELVQPGWRAGPRMAPFLIHHLSTREPLKAASRIREALDEGHPVAFAIRCPGRARWLARLQSGGHAFDAAVDAGYEGKNRWSGSAIPGAQRGGRRLPHLASRGFPQVAAIGGRIVAGTNCADLD